MRLISKTVAALLAAGFLSLGSTGISAAGFSARCEDKASQRSYSRYLQRGGQRHRQPQMEGRPSPAMPPALVSPTPLRSSPRQPDWVQNLSRKFGATAGNL